MVVVRHIFLAIFLFLSVCTSAQKLQEFFYPVSTFQHGHKVVATARSDNGLMYVATDIDVYQFDGFEFISLNIRNRLKTEILDLVGSIDNGLFISTQKGLFHYGIKDKEFDKVTSSQMSGLKYNFTIERLSGFHKDSIFLWNGRKLYAKKLPTNVNDSEFHKGKLFVGTSQKLYGLDYSFFAETEGVPNVILDEGIYSINKAKEGLRMLSSSSLLLFNQYDEFKQISSIPFSAIGAKMSMDAFNETYVFQKDGTIWKYDQLSWLQYKLSSPFDMRSLNSVKQDDELIIWMTSNNGLVKMPASPTLTYEIENNEEDILETVLSENTFYLLSDDHRAFRYHYDFKKRTMRSKSVLTGVSDLMVSGQNVYLLKEGGMLELYRGEELLNRTSALVDDFNQGIKLATANEVQLVYISNENILKSYSGGSVKDVLSFTDEVLSLHITDDNIIWIGLGNNQLMKIRAGESPVSFQGQNTEGGNALVSQNAQGQVWFFNTEQGLGTISQSNEVVFPEIDFLKGGYNVYNIFFDPDGNLWLFTSEGIYSVLVEDLELKTYEKLDRYSGLPFSTVSGNNAVVDKENNIWIGAIEGLVQYSSIYNDPNLFKPKVYLREVRIEYNNLLSTQPDSLLSAQYDSATLEVGYHDEVKILPRNNSFQKFQYSKVQVYRDDDFSAWKDYNNNEYITLDGLEEGQNRILIRGVNADNLFGDQVFVLNVLVGKPVWRSKEFYLMLGGAVFILAIGIFFFARFIRSRSVKEMKVRLANQREQMDEQAHSTILRAEKLQQLNDLISDQKVRLEEKNQVIERNKYELELSNKMVNKQKDLLEETTKRLTSSINHAQRIQNALMPPSELLTTIFSDFFILFKPRDVVSGDFYWFSFPEEDSNSKLVITAVDCTGHGVPGAFVSAMGINLLNAIVEHKGIFDAGEILTHLNNDLNSILRTQETKVNDGMDIAFCSIDTSEDVLYFAGAKNPLLIVKDNEIELLKGSAAPIGHSHVFGNTTFTSRTLPIDKEAVYYMYSDGYQDQFGGEDGRKFMSKKFRNKLLEIHQMPFSDQKEELDKTITAWQGTDYKQTDDILVIGFKF